MSHHSANWGKKWEITRLPKDKKKEFKRNQKRKLPPPPQKAGGAATEKGTGSKGNYKKTKHGNVRALIHCGFNTSIGFKNLQVESYVYG